MKTLILARCFLGMVFAGGLAAVGFAHDGLNSSPVIAPSAAIGAAASPGSVTQAAMPMGGSTAAPQSQSPVPTVSGGSGNQASPAALQFSPWVFEVQRLTQAAVDEGVVLSYVTNTAGTFNLTADQIVYLKNLGVSPQVITAMLLHDQDLISGARPLTASSAPPAPSTMQAALAASLHAPNAGAAAPANVAAPVSDSGGSIIAPDDDAGTGGTWVWVEPDDVPSQSRSADPVRLPYPVKLNDPIIVLTLPSFSLPCW